MKNILENKLIALVVALSMCTVGINAHESRLRRAHKETAEALIANLQLLYPSAGTPNGFLTELPNSHSNSIALLGEEGQLAVENSKDPLIKFLSSTALTPQDEVTDRAKQAQKALDTFLSSYSEEKKDAVSLQPKHSVEAYPVTAIPSFNAQQTPESQQPLDGSTPLSQKEALDVAPTADLTALASESFLPEASFDQTVTSTASYDHTPAKPSQPLQEETTTFSAGQKEEDEAAPEELIVSPDMISSQEPSQKTESEESEKNENTSGISDTSSEESILSEKNVTTDSETEEVSSEQMPSLEDLKALGIEIPAEEENNFPLKNS